jgi:hypothetical protein
MDKRQRYMCLLMTAAMATIGLVLAGWTSFGPQSMQGGAPSQSGVPTATPASSGPPQGAPRPGQPNVAAQRAAMSKLGFLALATISYDDVTATYRFRAYNDGEYLDTKLSVSGQGFSWGYTAGPATITNTMRLTPAGAWSEQTTTRVGAAPPRTTVAMTLHRL